MNENTYGKQGTEPIRELRVQKGGDERLIAWWDRSAKDSAWNPRRVWSRLHRKTERPTPEMMEAVPIHAQRVEPLDLERAKWLMLPHIRERFDYLWNEITRPSVSPYLKNNSPVSKDDLSHADVKSLLGADIIERVDNESTEPTRAWVFPFTNLEQREGKFRRRFIAWPKEHNNAIEESYDAVVPLQQPVTYTAKVQEETATLRDLASAFYQVELPGTTRSYYRFRHNGAIYQMKRMPMGHAMAPEVMQTLTGIIAGHTAYTTAPSE